MRKKLNIHDPTVMIQLQSNINVQGGFRTGEDFGHGLIEKKLTISSFGDDPTSLIKLQCPGLFTDWRRFWSLSKREKKQWRSPTLATIQRRWSNFDLTSMSGVVSGLEKTLFMVQSRKNWRSPALATIQPQWSNFNVRLSGVVRYDPNEKKTDDPTSKNNS